jgi:hypothetical protein
MFTLLFGPYFVQLALFWWCIPADQQDKDQRARLDIIYLKETQKLAHLGTFDYIYNLF